MKVLRKQEIETANIQVGDQVIIPLAGRLCLCRTRNVWRCSSVRYFFHASA